MLWLWISIGPLFPMCGRVACTLPPQRIQRIGRARRMVRHSSSGVAPRPRYNVGPMSRLPCIYTRSSGEASDGNSSGERCLEYMSWGLQGQGTQHLSTINARIETVATSRIYSPHLIHRERCVLIVDGFFEWYTKKDGSKTPYFIRFNNDVAEKPLPSEDTMDLPIEDDAWPVEQQFWESAGTIREPLLMACLYAPPVVEDDPHSFTIMTMESAGPVTKIHDRMPVLLTPECAAEWIDRSRASDTALLRKIAEVARETAKQSVTAYEVPTLANNIRNDVSDCLLPLSAWKKKQFDNGLGRFFKKAAKKQETEAPERQPDDAEDPPAKKRKAE